MEAYNLRATVISISRNSSALSYWIPIGEKNYKLGRPSDRPLMSRPLTFHYKSKLRIRRLTFPSRRQDIQGFSRWASGFAMRDY
jgi:hypothetical protein